MVFSYFGMDVSEEELAQRTEATRDLGTTAEKMKAAAEKYGLQAEIQNGCELQDITAWLEKDAPVIVDWFTRGRDDYAEDISSADGHYSVVNGIDDIHIYLQDPEIGKERKMRKDIFERVWFDFEGDRIRPNELIVRQIIAIHR